MLSQLRVCVFVFVALVTLQLRSSHQKVCDIVWRTRPVDESPRTGPVDEGPRNVTVDEGPPNQTGPAYNYPIWSAGMRQQHTNVSELDALMRWRYPGKQEKVEVARSVTEVLTYALAGVLPWYGTILPAIRFERPFTNTTGVEIAMVEGLRDVTMDLHQCSEGRPEENTTADGTYDVCFNPNDGSRDALKKWCFDKMRSAQSRKHNFPDPGHERWSCSDHAVMEQMVAQQVMDYIVPHGDRFYQRMTNNLFLDTTQPQASFVSIDHHGMAGAAFRRRQYWHDVSMKVLLKHPLPAPLRDNLQTAARLGKDEFVQKFNATIDGELDNVSRVLEQLYREVDPRKQRKYDANLTELLWYRLNSVVHFFKINITLEE